MPHCRLLPTLRAVNLECFNANEAWIMDATKTNWSQTVPPERSCGGPGERYLEGVVQAVILPRSTETFRLLAAPCPLQWHVLELCVRWK